MNVEGARGIGGGHLITSGGTGRVTSRGWRRCKGRMEGVHQVSTRPEYHGKQTDKANEMNKEYEMNETK